MNNKNILSLRMKNKMSVEEMSKLLDISVDRIRSWENDESAPTAQELKKLSIFFEVSTDFLLGIEEKPAKVAEEPANKSVVAEKKVETKNESAETKTSKAEKKPFLSKWFYLAFPIAFALSILFMALPAYGSDSFSISIFDIFFKGDHVGFLISGIFYLTVGSLSSIYFILILCLNKSNLAKFNLANTIVLGVSIIINMILSIYTVTLLALLVDFDSTLFCCVMSCLIWFATWIYAIVLEILIVVKFVKNLNNKTEDFEYAKSASEGTESKRQAASSKKVDSNKSPILTKWLYIFYPIAYAFMFLFMALTCYSTNGIIGTTLPFELSLFNVLLSKGNTGLNIGTIFFLILAATSIVYYIVNLTLNKKNLAKLNLANMIILGVSIVMNLTISIYTVTLIGFNYITFVGFIAYLAWFTISIYSIVLAIIALVKINKNDEDKPEKTVDLTHMSEAERKLYEYKQAEKLKVEQEKKAKREVRLEKKLELRKTTKRIYETPAIFIYIATTLLAIASLVLIMYLNQVLTFSGPVSYNLQVRFSIASLVAVISSIYYVVLMCLPSRIRANMTIATNIITGISVLVVAIFLAFGDSFVDYCDYAEICVCVCALILYCLLMLLSYFFNIRIARKQNK